MAARRAMPEIADSLLSAVRARTTAVRRLRCSDGDSHAVVSTSAISQLHRAGWEAGAADDGDPVR